MVEGPGSNVLYNATKSLEAGVQVLGKPNTKIKDNWKTLGTEQFFVWTVVKNIRQT